MTKRGAARRRRTFMNKQAKLSLLYGGRCPIAVFFALLVRSGHRRTATPGRRRRCRGFQDGGPGFLLSLSLLHHTFPLPSLSPSARRGSIRRANRQHKRPMQRTHCPTHSSWKRSASLRFVGSRQFVTGRQMLVEFVAILRPAGERSGRRNTQRRLGRCDRLCAAPRVFAWFNSRFEFT